MNYYNKMMGIYINDDGVNEFDLHDDEFKSYDASNRGNVRYKLMTGDSKAQARS